MVFDLYVLYADSFLGSAASDKAENLARGGIYFVFCSAGLGVPLFLPFRLPLSFDVAFSATSFFLLGWLIPNRIIPRFTEKQKKTILHPVWLLPELVLGTFLALKNGYVNMRLILYQNPVLFYLSATMLSLAVLHGAYHLSRLLGKSRKLLDKLLFLGQNTLTILVLNQFFIQAAKLLVNQMPLYLQRSAEAKYALWFIFAVCFMAVMIPVIRLINKGIPFAVGRKK